MATVDCDDSGMTSIPPMPDGPNKDTEVLRPEALARNQPEEFHRVCEAGFRSRSLRELEHSAEVVLEVGVRAAQRATDIPSR
jgi:hypothetical protein